MLRDVVNSQAKRRCRGRGPERLTAAQWLRRDWLLSTFGGTRNEAIERYVQLVAEGIGEPLPWEHVRHQMFLGSEAFVENFRRNIPKDRDLSEIPRAQRRPVPKTLAEYARGSFDRDKATATAYASGYTKEAIGEHFGLHYSQVIRIVNRMRNARFQTRLSIDPPTLFSDS
jgi:putative transposase